jgi:uncharacterized protein (TIGR02145 family)
LTVDVDAAAADWCTLSNMYYNTATIIDIVLIIKENLMAEKRIAHVTVSDGMRSEVITITQEAGRATLSVDHTIVELDCTAGTYAIPVTSNNALWTAVVDDATNNTWCTLTTASGKGNGAIIVNTKNTVSRRYTTITVSTGALRDSVIVYQHGVLNNSAGAKINGVTWAIRNVDDFGTFAPLNPQDPTQLFGKFYQFNRAVAYTSTDPLSPAWNNTSPGSGNWSLINDPCPGGWRVPSQLEFQSLEASGWRWVTAEESEYGVPGTWFGPGAHEDPHPMFPTNAVFFPAAGARILSDGHLLSGSDHLSQWHGDNGCYWSSETIYGFPPPMLFGAGGIYISRGHMWNSKMALSIRCVKR